MSVIRFMTETFAEIATTIKNSIKLRDNFYTIEEHQLINHIKQTPKEYQEDLNHAILCFTERLNIANLLAYEYTYNRSGSPIIIERLTPKQLDGKTLSLPEFHTQLKSIRYNLISNSGRIFLGGEDTKRLETLITISKIPTHITQLKDR